MMLTLQHGKLLFVGDNACQNGVDKVCDTDNPDDDAQHPADGDNQGGQVIKGAYFRYQAVRPAWEKANRQNWKKGL